MYLVIYKITRHQIYFWSAIIMIDYKPHAYVDTENLAETFIGKLFSEEWNTEQNLLD